MGKTSERRALFDSAESVIETNLNEINEKIEVPVFCGYRINFNGNPFNILFGFNPPESENALFYLTSQMYFKQGEIKGQFHLYRIPEDYRDRMGCFEDEELDGWRTQSINQPLS